MAGWLVNDRLTAIPGTRTFWHHLLDGIPGLVDKCAGQYSGLAESVEFDAAREEPDYIIRNAAYFRRLDVVCPVIAFVQDILQGPARDLLVDACAGSQMVVFNSEYTRMRYPELAHHNAVVIPIGTDETIFKPCDPEPDIPSGAVLWVGSGHPVKGFDLAHRLATESDRPWVFVMKDDTEVPAAAKVYRRISQEQLARIASACAVGVCTSREETQHLAGIEMGMCGLPLVTTPVGAYYERPWGAWGFDSDGDWHGDIERAVRIAGSGPALYWRRNGFTLTECLDAWNTAVRTIEALHVG